MEMDVVIRGRQLGIELVLIALLLSIVCLGCNSKAGGLPRTAKDTLDKKVAKMAGSEVDYRVISCQKAADQSESNLEQALSSRQRSAGACPEDEIGTTIWCIVLDQEITNEKGQGYSRFLVKQVGLSWSAEELSEDESDLFNYCGCQNWNAAKKQN